MAKNGRDFEQKIHENERHNAKFAFMGPNDPYHQYYQKRLRELLASGPEGIAQAISTGLPERDAPPDGAPSPHAHAPHAPHAPHAHAPEPLEFLLDAPDLPGQRVRHGERLGERGLEEEVEGAARSQRRRH